MSGGRVRKIEYGRKKVNLKVVTIQRINDFGLNQSGSSGDNEKQLYLGLIPKTETNGLDG